MHSPLMPRCLPTTREAGRGATWEEVSPMNSDLMLLVVVLALLVRLTRV